MRLKQFTLITLFFIVIFNKYYAQIPNVKVVKLNAISVIEYYDTGFRNDSSKEYSYCKKYLLTSKKDTIPFSYTHDFLDEFPTIKSKLGKDTTLSYRIPNKDRFYTEYYSGNVISVRSRHIYDNILGDRRIIAYRVKMKVNIFTGIDLAKIRDHYLDFNIPVDRIPIGCWTNRKYSSMKFCTINVYYKYAPLRNKDLKKYGLKKVEANIFSVIPEY